GHHGKVLPPCRHRQGRPDPDSFPARNPSRSSSSAAAAPPASIHPRHRRVTQLLRGSACGAILNDASMGGAIPRLMASFGVSADAAQWLTTAFLLTMATVIPVTGFMLQRMNTRPVFLLAMSLFTLGTLAASLAPGLKTLVVARIIQACGTA